MGSLTGTIATSGLGNAAQIAHQAPHLDRLPGFACGLQGLHQALRRLVDITNVLPQAAGNNVETLDLTA